MKISEFCWEDIAPVFAILATENNGAWTYEQLEHSLKLENVICYVAKNDDKVLGFVLIEETPYDFDILEIVVDENLRGRGIGTMLLKRVIDYAKLTHKEKATLEVASDNKNAIMFYEKFGFSQIGMRKNYYKNGNDALVFQKTFI